MRHTVTVIDVDEGKDIGEATYEDRMDAVRCVKFLTDILDSRDYLIELSHTHKSPSPSLGDLFG